MKETTEYDLPFKILDLMGIGFILGSIILIIYNYNSLPATIPIHFNLYGEPDGWGPKISIFLIPFLGLFPIGVLSLALYATNQSENKVDKKLQIQNILSANLLRYLRVEIGLLFLLSTFGIIKSAIENTDLPIFSILLPILLIFGTIIWYFILLIKSKNKHEKNS